MRGLSDNSRGALLMIAAMGLFTANDSFIKGIGTAIGVWQVLFLRGVGVSVVMVPFLWWRGVSLGVLSRRDMALAIGRTLAEAAAAICFLTALQHMPFANLSAIQQALPLTVTLAGFLFLREQVGWRRGLAIGIGLAGVLLIVRPGTEGFNGWSLLALGSVACVTVRDIFARMLSPGASTLAVAAISALGMTLISALALPFTGWDPVAPEHALLLLGSIAAIFVAYIVSVSAMRVGELGFVAPFRYFSLLVAVLVGLVFFAEIPDLPTVAGAGIIVASGLYTLWRERRLAA